jgi:hypothetical protein
MKRIFFALVFGAFFACGAAWSQDITAVVGTKLPDNTRFEVVQTPFDKAIVFRLDKYTGQVHRLTTCQKDDSTLSDKCWKEMTIVSPTKDSSMRGPRFQIAFMTTSATQKLTLLLNLETGQAWQYGLDNVNDKWFPFMECDERSINCRWKP